MPTMQVDGANGSNITYSELRRNVIRCAAALYSFGMRRGDRVCLLLTNCIECPIVMLAIMQLGAICVTINYMFTKCLFTLRLSILLLSVDLYRVIRLTVLY